MRKIFESLLSVFLIAVIVFSTVTTVGYAQDNTTDLTVDDYEISATNSLGDMLQKEFEESSVEDPTKKYEVADLNFSGNTATVNFTAIGDCTLVVAIYDEITQQMLFYEMADVTADVSSPLSVEFSETLPELFLAKAFLVDDTYSPLCVAYTDRENTTEFREFLSKTTDDFEEELILNLDSSYDNNFAVVSEDTTVVQEEKGVNILVSSDNENGIYVFENADEKINGLVNGDKFYFSSIIEDNYIVIVVDSVTVEGGYTTVVASEAELEDIFDYIKIESFVCADSDSLDFSEMDEGLIYEGSENTFETNGFNENITSSLNVSFNFALKKEWKNNKKKHTLEGGVKFSIGYEFKCYYDIEIFGDKYLETSFKITTNETVGVTVSFSDSIEKTLKLPEIVFPVVAGLTVKLEPKFVVSGKCEIEVNLQKDSEIGFTYDTDQGAKWISDSNTDTEIDSELSIQISFGLNMSGKLKLLEVITMEISAQVGVKIAGVFEAPVSDQLVQHTCQVCIDGDCKAYFTAGFKFVFGFSGSDGLSWTPIDISLINKEKKLFDFYISANSGCALLSYGRGSCPHKAYKITFNVVGKYDAPVSGAKLFNGKTMNNGMYSVYLADGIHRYTVTSEKYVSYSECVTVNGSAKTVIVKLKSASDSLLPTEQFIYTPINGGKTYEISGISEDIDPESFTEIVIPSTYKGKPVTRVGNDAFVYCSYLERVTISEGIKEIGSYAFSGCVLNFIKLPESLEIIESCAFMNSFMTEVYIPSNVRKIGELTFYSNNLSKITVSPKNKYFCTDEYGVLFNADKTELVQYPDKINLRYYLVPETVKCLRIAAIDNCEYLEYAYLPDSISGIIECCFRFMEKLKCIRIPDGVIEFSNAFYKTHTLESIYIPKNVNRMYNCLNNNKKLTDIYFEGDEYQWNSIEFLRSDISEDATIHYNSSPEEYDAMCRWNYPEIFRDIPRFSTFSEDLEFFEITTESTTHETFSFTGCVPGNEYIFMNLTGSNPVADSLLYIDQYVADSQGDIFATYIPSCNIENSKFAISGDFGNGNEMKILNPDVILDLDVASCDVDSLTVSYLNKFGILPEPIRDGFIFGGWYAENGVEITAETVVEHAKTYTLSPRWILNVENNGSTISVDLYYKTITGNSLSGMDADELESLFSEFQISVEGDITTDANVKLISADLAFGDDFKVIVFGDVNCDGVLDGQDAVVVSCIANGMLTSDDISEAVSFAADYNKDGLVDEPDSRLLADAGLFSINSN